MEKQNKKTYTGVVVSDKASKTISVLVETYKKHRLYGKKVKRSKKFHAHDENSIAKVGDIVKIQESRPLSATKRFVLVEVVETKTIV